MVGHRSRRGSEGIPESVQGASDRALSHSGSDPFEGVCAGVVGHDITYF